MKIGLPIVRFDQQGSPANIGSKLGEIAPLHVIGREVIPAVAKP